MKTIYTINKNDTLNSLKYLVRRMYALPFLLILSVPFAHYIKGMDWETSKELAPLFALFAVFIFQVIPTTIMHLTHYISNKELTVEIDRIEQTITFKKGNGTYCFHFEDLIVELYIPIYHKNKIDSMKRWATPWSNYSYMKVISKDNKEFNISSTLIRPEELPLHVEKTNYSLWPVIKNWFVNRQEIIDAEFELERERLNRWKDKFSALTLEEIERKLSNAERLDDYPKKALMDLRNEKKLLISPKS
ncbi:hypothetical protein MM213_20340 [Belliella sp. R4-6]|uniref:PH domain-containing protein n=1 Tax=Belliella alkalica TaxID=1730871 RepID=A0ABS9VHE0_9BACT|nr:hypothetical protein [Belliella alkalica]MCH7415861.1 hypothetical protein [Belliella alkalica]